MLPSHVKELAEQGDLEGAAVAYIEALDWVTYVELAQFLAPYMPVEGDCSLEICPNGVLWAGMSPEFADLMAKLGREGRVVLQSGSQMVYIMDGGMLNLPVAKRAPKEHAKGYAKPRWLVAALRTPSRAEAVGSKKGSRVTC